MDGQSLPQDPTAPDAALRARLALAPDGRLAGAVVCIAAHLAEAARDLRASPADLRAVLSFLTEVGEATTEHRQEWVLLADVLGLTSLVAGAATEGGTPGTLPGPFYRANAPLYQDCDSICLDGQGVPMTLHWQVTGPGGQPVAGALVEVWQANGDGIYENQAPDLQPEWNLRGRFSSGADGRLTVQTVRPGGYAIPSDGPVGALMARLGLSARRPAHVHARITAPGFHSLTTHVFDQNDPAIAADPLFAVHPDLMAAFVPDGQGGFLCGFTFVLAPLARRGGGAA
jgi:hydroxyquinol 1,2-dioxygenase